MADRYQDRSYGVRGPSRGSDNSAAGRDENDPLAELARLIGQTDPFGTTGKSALQAPPRPTPGQDSRPQYRQDYQQDYAQDYQAEPEVAAAPPSPPAWMQRANIRREPSAPRHAPVPNAAPQEPAAYSEDYVNPVHPLHRYAAQPQAPQADTYYQDEPTYQPQQAYVEPEQEADPSRYDEALYGQLESNAQDFQREPAYPDDPYAYQAAYEEEGAEQPLQRRRSPMLAVIAVLLLGVIGTGAAYAYRTYFSVGHHGEPPIIKADNSPTKVVPAQADAASKVPDRMAVGDGTEKLVPREEQPVDVATRAAGPRVVFPPLNQNANPPAVASVAPTAMPAPQQAAGGPVAPSNGTLPNSEPRKIKTFSVRGDQPDAASVPVNTPPPATPAAKPAKNSSRAAASQANASANGPLSLAPQASQPAEPATRMASTAPTQIAPAAPSAGGGYLVSITSQTSEAEARAAFRSMQGKYPSVLGSQSPVVARATSKSGAVMYRAGVSFASSAEATQFCHSYEAAGGQCWVVKN